MEIKDIEKIAKSVLVENGSHERQFMFVSPDGKYENVLIEKHSDFSETLVLKYIREYIKTNKIDKYYMMFESWMGKNKNVRPSEDSEKREALCILEFNKDGKNKQVFQFFKRVKKKIIFEERIAELDYKNSATKFDFFKSEDEIQKNMDKLMRMNI